MGKTVAGVLPREPGAGVLLDMNDSLSGLGFFIRVLALSLFSWVAFGVLYVAINGVLIWVETGRPILDVISRVSALGLRELAIGGVLSALSGIVFGLTAVYLSGVVLAAFYITSLAQHLDSVPLTIGLGLMLLLLVRFTVYQLIDSIRRRLESVGVPWIFAEAEATHIALLSSVPFIGTYHMFLLLVESRVGFGDAAAPRVSEEPRA